MRREGEGDRTRKDVGVMPHLELLACMASLVIGLVVVVLMDYYSKP